MFYAPWGRTDGLSPLLRVVSCHCNMGNPSPHHCMRKRLSCAFGRAEQYTLCPPNTPVVYTGARELRNDETKTCRGMYFPEQDTSTFPQIVVVETTAKSLRQSQSFKTSSTKALLTEERMYSALPTNFRLRALHRRSSVCAVAKGAIRRNI